ncbi:hypothetical protein CRUP_015716 [Coryphaenoides rupestris]|nr:hypothetical protein CRUP_015716 [Coryphaenoides rupestris]
MQKLLLLLLLLLLRESVKGVKAALFSDAVSRDCPSRSCVVRRYGCSAERRSLVTLLSSPLTRNPHIAAFSSGHQREHGDRDGDQQKDQSCH